MRTIWKYPLRTGRWNHIDVPADARVVLAAIDPASGAPAIWIDHERPDLPRLDANAAPAAESSQQRSFIVVATGREIDPADKHVGSMIDRSYVWHVFERGQ